MSRDKNRERDIINDLDSLLAGKKVNTEGKSEDERTILELAKRYTECRAEPSAEFHDSLKRRLALKLAEQEARAQRDAERREQRWSWLSGFMMQSPVRRAAIVAAVAVAITFGTLWARGTFTDQTGPIVVTPNPEPEIPILTVPAPGPLTEPVFQAIATTEKALYTAGEEITIEFSFINTSSETVTVVAYPPQIDIRNAENDQTVRRSPAGTGKQELAPFETLGYTLVWDQMDSRGHQVPPGIYTITIDNISFTSPTQPEAVLAPLGNLAEINIQSP